MKRPFPIYFVALWCLLVLSLQLSGVERGLKEGLSEVQIPPEIGRWCYTGAGILILWHIVRLIQLKAFNRWFSILVFSFSTLASIWYLFVTLPNAQNYVRPVVGILIFCLLNGACIWYLARRSFRQFAADLVAQREAEKRSQEMQKASQKKISDDLRT